jgi:hypothetical protein
MTARKKIAIALYLSITIAALCLAAALVIFSKSYEDPRWRVFDFNSRQASEIDIYAVAEVPVISSAKLVGHRKLRIGFQPPIRTSSWTVKNAADGNVLSQGPHPDIQMPDSASNITYLLVPGGVTLPRDISILISFYPKENYHKAGLSWPDNYFAPYSSLRFSMKRPHSIDEWTGLTPADPDVAEAGKLLEGVIDPNAPVRTRLEQVFRFVMHEMRNSGGTPTDSVLNASPLETYNLLCSGKGKGFCENRALVFYLFANAAGVKTRLVDIAGKFGPLKLTGHYFCESWLPEQASWCIVDPMSSAAYVINTGGRLLSALDIKKLFDADNFTGCTVRTYDPAGDSLMVSPVDAYYAGNKGYFNDMVMAYKFGYPKNRSYSKIEHFLKYPTLLYSPFALPRLYLVKTAALWGFMSGAILSIIFGAWLLLAGRPARGAARGANGGVKK